MERDFVSDFVHPFVTGGALHVGAPLDADDVVSLRAETVSPSSELNAIERRANDYARTIWPTPINARLDRELMGVLAATHNFFFFSHPEVEGWTVRERRMEEVAEFSLHLCREVGEPATERELILRHVFFRRLPHVAREDVDLRFWVGRRHFQGQTPPARLLRWPNVRRVRRDQQRVVFLNQDLGVHQQSILGEIMRVTPLTGLLSLEFGAPPVVHHFIRVAPYLCRPRIARLLAWHYSEEGVYPRVAPVLAEGFWRIARVARQAASGTTLAVKARTAVCLWADMIHYLYAGRFFVGQPDDQISFTNIEESLPGVMVAISRAGLLAQPGRSNTESGATLQLAVAQWAGQLGATVEQLTAMLQDLGFPAGGAPAIEDNDSAHAVGAELARQAEG